MNIKILKMHLYDLYAAHITNIIPSSKIKFNKNSHLHL